MKNTLDENLQAFHIFQQPRVRRAKVTDGEVMAVQSSLLLAEAGAHLQKMQLLEAVIRSWAHKQWKPRTVQWLHPDSCGTSDCPLSPFLPVGLLLLSCCLVCLEESPEPPPEAWRSSPRLGTTCMTHHSCSGCVPTQRAFRINWGTCMPCPLQRDISPGSICTL